jgi:aminoglycoside phosphotransferase (APT) family kinase protein
MDVLEQRNGALLADERKGVRISSVKADLVRRALAAATALGEAAGLSINDAVVIYNSNKLAVRLLPCEVLARVALLGQEVARLEVALAQRLTAVASPVAALDPRVAPAVHIRDGFAVTFWTYYETVTPDHYSPVDYADALRRLHLGMRGVEIAAPHVMDRVAEAERLVTTRCETPALADGDRQLLCSTLRSARQQIPSRRGAEQLLHGEPHPGNLLNTAGGLLFIDFESCCRGPVEFDVAHLPGDVGAQYPDLDRMLLDECRRLVLAMVAAWRWDVRDEFPNGTQHGQDIVAALREGPPWPVLGVLGAE